jgi:hypothetical protein
VKEQIIALFKENFSIEKHWWRTFFGNSTTGHFSVNFFSNEAPQVILDIMTPVSSLYHVWGLRKMAVTNTHTDFEYCIYRFQIQ